MTKPVSPQCSMCLRNSNKNKMMMSPMTCVLKHGARAHKICDKCWFDKFAKENANHQCPGCKTRIPLTIPPNAKSTPAVIILD